jgi:hypothetical protein
MRLEPALPPPRAEFDVPSDPQLNLGLSEYGPWLFKASGSAQADTALANAPVPLVAIGPAHRPPTDAPELPVHDEVAGHQGRAWPGSDGAAAGASRPRVRRRNSNEQQR